MKRKVKTKPPIAPELSKYMAELVKQRHAQSPKPRSYYQHIGQLGGKVRAKRSPKPRSFYQRIGILGGTAKTKKYPKPRSFYQRIGRLGAQARHGTNKPKKQS